jgi:hypothetical protein
MAQLSDYVFEDVEETVEPEPARLEPYPAVAVVSAAPRSGATTVARLLAAELSARDGAAVVTSPTPVRRHAPPSRAAIRLATALSGVGHVQPLGRICVARSASASELSSTMAAARYLGPAVLDLPPDGSAAGAASLADRIVVVAGATDEPALLDAVATIVGGDPVKLVNRVSQPGDWASRADVLLPDSRIAARAAALGTRALGGLGDGIASLAEALR